MPVRFVRIPFAVCEIRTVWSFVSSVPLPRMKFSRCGICWRSDGTFGLSLRKWTLSKMMKTTCLMFPFADFSWHVDDGPPPCDGPPDGPMRAAATLTAARHIRARTPMAPTLCLRVICSLPFVDRGTVTPLQPRWNGQRGEGRLQPGEAHPVVHRLERGCRCGARLLGAEREQASELRLVPADLLVTARDRVEQLDDRLGYVSLERPVARAVVAGLDLSEALARRDRHDLDQVGHTRLLLGRVADVRPGVRHGRLELLADDVGQVEQEHGPLRRAARLRHLHVRLLQVHHAGALFGIDAFGDDERLPEAVVEPLRDVARELEVLALIVPDRDDVRLVEEDVSGHQGRVCEEPGGDELVLRLLLLELRH